MSLFKRVAALGLLCLLSFSAMAQWRLDSRVDGMTDKEIRSAVVSNAEGYTFSISRASDTGRVWILFMPPVTGLDLVDNKTIQTRFDKYPPHSHSPQPLEMERLVGKMWIWTPRSVANVVWHGKDGDGRNDFMTQIMTSSTLLVRFAVAGGGLRDVTFDISGAGPVVADALGIPEKVDPALQAQLAAFNQTLLAEASRCTSAADRRQCHARISSCVSASDKDAVKLKACLSQ